MAGFAQITAVDMVCRFSGSDRAIVATNAGTDNLAMINGRIGNGCPQRRCNRVTQMTFVSRVYMGSAFAAGRYTVMTTNTVIDKG